MSNDPKKTLPVTRTHSNEIDCVFSLLATINELGRMEDIIGKRLDVIPYGRRDLHLLKSVTAKLIANVVRTMPQEKGKMIQRMMRIMTYKVSCGPQASKANPNDCFVDANHLKHIVIAAQQKCQICFGSDGKKCRSCELGKALDTTLKIDRGDLCWGDIDFSDWAKNEEL